MKIWYVSAFISHIMDKRQRQNRSSSAVNGRHYSQGRVSLGEQAKQALRSVSLINNHQERTIEQWSEEDLLSIISLHPYQSPMKTARTKGKIKKGIAHTRGSMPVIAPSDIQRKNLVPFCLNIEGGQNQKRIHSVSQQRNFACGKLQIYKELIFKNTSPLLNRSFRPASQPLSRRKGRSKSLANQLEFSRDFCKQIVPLKIQQFEDMREGKDSKRTENLASSKAYVIRKMLKQLRKNTFNQTIFRKQFIRPQL